MTTEGPPRVGSLWQEVGRKGYCVAAEVEVLVGTEGRFLVRFEFFNDQDEPMSPGSVWVKDKTFRKHFCKLWTRYDMILDELDD